MNRLIRFNAVATIGVALQLAILWTLTSSLAGVDVLSATMVAVGVTILHNFCWHVRWTWADRVQSGRRTLDRLVRFAAANGLVSMIGNVVLMGVLAGALHVPALAANLIAIALCGLVNFAIADRAVFDR